jgi:hypothetical protein
VRHDPRYAATDLVVDKRRFERLSVFFNQELVDECFVGIIFSCCAPNFGKIKYSVSQSMPILKYLNYYVKCFIVLFLIISSLSQYSEIMILTDAVATMIPLLVSSVTGGQF